MIVRAPSHAIAGAAIPVTIELTCARPTTLHALDIGVRLVGTFGLPSRIAATRVLGRTVLPAGLSTFETTVDLDGDTVPTLHLGHERHQLELVATAVRPWKRDTAATCEVAVGTGPAPLTPMIVRAPDGTFAIDLPTTSVAIGEALTLEVRLPSPALGPWQFSGVLVPVLLRSGTLRTWLPETPCLPLTVLEPGGVVAIMRTVLPPMLAPSFVAVTLELRWLLRLLAVRPDDDGWPVPMAIDVPIRITGHAGPASADASSGRLTLLEPVMRDVAVRRGWQVTRTGSRLRMLRTHPAGVLAMWIVDGGRSLTFDLAVSWHGAVQRSPATRGVELVGRLSEGGSVTMLAPTGAPDGARVHLVSRTVDFMRLDRLVHDVVRLADQQTEGREPEATLTWGELATDLDGRPALADLAIVGDVRGRTVQTRVAWDDPLDRPVVRVVVGSPAQTSEATRAMTIANGQLATAGLERIADLLASLPAEARAVELYQGVLRA